MRLEIWLSAEGGRDLEILRRSWRLQTKRSVIERALQETAKRERGV